MGQYDGNLEGEKKLKQQKITKKRNPAKYQQSALRLSSSINGGFHRIYFCVAPQRATKTFMRDLSGGLPGKAVSLCKILPET